MDLSVIIVNHNGYRVTKRAVESVLATVKFIDYEILVVDNSDSCGEVFKFENSKVRVIDGVENNGFGNACNIGAKRANGDYLLFLNSDSVLCKNTVCEAYSYIVENSGIGVLGVRQLLGNGKLDAGCKRGFPTPLVSLYYFSGLSRLFKKSKRFGRYQQTYVDEYDVCKVDCVSGAFMLVKKIVFENIGGFDEDYFMYGEDVDLCYRLVEKGFFNVYYGKVWFIHLKGKSGYGNLRVLKSFYDSMQIFYDKHYKNRYCFFVGLLVKIGIKLKYFIARVIYFKRNGFKKE